MSLISFNRLVAKHLAQALGTGAECDQELVERCYAATRQEVGLLPDFPPDAMEQGIQTLCIANDLQALQHHYKQLARMSLADAETAIYRLLNPDLRIR